MTLGRVPGPYVDRTPQAWLGPPQAWLGPSLGGVLAGPLS
jgi:hypothetical protein